MKNPRQCIYTKDVQLITGKTEGACRKLLQRMKKKLNKKPHQVISLREFSNYIGLTEEEVREHLSN